MDFTIIIPFYNGQQHIKRLLDSIPKNISVIIIDDLSDTPYSDATLRLRDKGFFTGAVNAGIDLCQNDVLILNQDTYFSGDKWLNFLEQNAVKYDLIGEKAGKHPSFPNRYIHGTFMYIKRKVIDTIGVMDNRNFPLWGSTADYQLRAARAGFKALPTDIPDFNHTRKGSYGTSIQSVLKKYSGVKGLLIRTPPLISVIITNYNYGKYIPDAIASLIGGKSSLGNQSGQSFQGFEIIIVDDGSTDNSREILNKIADDNKLIKVIYQKNRGSAAACNAGIQASTTKHNIAILDGDDMMKPDRLQTMLDTLTQNSHSAIYDNITYFSNGQEGFVNDFQTMKRYKTLNLGEYDFDRLLRQNNMHKGLLYPIKAWHEAGGYPEIVNKGREDWAFNIALGIKGYCGVNTGQHDYLYRREGQNRTLKNTTPKWRQYFRNQMEKLYPEIYKGHRPMACCGKSDKKTVSLSATSSITIGQEGMTILEYTGTSIGDMTWRGPVTRIKYLFGGIRKRGYVDNRDVPGMLNLRDNGVPVFKIYEEVKAISEPVAIVADTQPETSIVADWEVALNPSEMTVAELEVAIQDLSQDDIAEILQLEKDGKNRTTAIKLLEAALV